jgi:hypothetical protein
MLIILVTAYSGYGRVEEEEERRRKLFGVEGVSDVIRRFCWWFGTADVRMVVVIRKAAMEEEKETCSGVAAGGKAAF